ncbi:MAG: porin family protein [Tannerella sp.]|nr:porin family protein [Tannerella sp.]
MKQRNLFVKVALQAVIAAAIVTNVSAQIADSRPQQGDMAVGINLVTGAGDHYINAGVGGMFRYYALAQLRGEGSFTYFLKKDSETLWDVSINAHYLLPAGGNVTVYPLAGASILGSSKGRGVGDIFSASYAAINLGAGVDFSLTDNFFFNVEAKYKITDYWNRLLFSAGVIYKF